MRFSYRGTSFPSDIPNGWIFDVPEVYGEINTQWIYYDTIQELNKLVDTSTTGKIVYSFASSSVSEGDKVDIQIIKVDFSSPLSEETTFNITISDGKVLRNNSIYPDTWIEQITDSITVAAGETSFEIPILVKGNVFLILQDFLISQYRRRIII
jgi:hypothetical protein